LKKSIFLKTAEIWGIENVYEKRERRLYGFLLQSFSPHFLVSEFFNSKGPGRWSGQSEKELVLAAPSLHPEPGQFLGSHA
jgi:hypothetical protein